MEIKIILTPQKVAVLTNLDLDYCILQCLGVSVHIEANKYVQNSTRRLKSEEEQKTLTKTRNKLKTVQFEVTDSIKVVNPNSIEAFQGVCILHEVIRQNNLFFLDFLKKLSENNECIKKIGFQGQFKYIEDVLTPENRKKAYEKLAQNHLYVYSDKTKEYQDYLLTTKTIDLCV